MTDTRPIVVPLDGSGLAETALPWAVFLAKRWGAPLTLLRVAEYAHYAAVSLSDAGYGWLAVETQEELVAAYLKERSAALRAAHPALDVRTAANLGDAAFSILALEREVDARLVVLTTHGRTGLARWARGSVAEKIVRHGTAPVLLVRPWDQAAAIARLEGRERDGLRVVVPLDGSPLAQGVLPLAMSLAAGGGGELILTGVIRTEDERAIGAGYRPKTAELRHDARQYLGQLAEDARIRGIAAHTVVGVEHDVAGAIVDLAAIESADLIALSTHGRGTLGRLLYGSIADRVAHASRVPVLLHRPQLARKVLETDLPAIADASSAVLGVPVAV